MLPYWRGLPPLNSLIPAGTGGRDIEQFAEVEGADLDLSYMNRGQRLTWRLPDGLKPRRQNVSGSILA